MDNKILRSMITFLFAIFFVASLIWTFAKIDSIDKVDNKVVNGNVTQTVNICNTLPETRTQKININTCSKEALESLPDIGGALAERIIEGRPYRDIYELTRVKGIGDAIIQSIKYKVVV